MDPVLASLDEAGVRVAEWNEVTPNPVDADVEAAASAMEAANPDAIVGIGGGSALDTAKGISVLATNGGRLADYSGVGQVPTRALPTVLIPTTAGTGSEVTANLSVTRSGTTDKIAVRDSNAYAAHAVLDPDLLRGLPAQPAAAAGIDALTHAVESYTSTRATEMTRFIALEAVQRIGCSLEAFVTDRSDTSAASSMLYASCLAGIVISHTGTGSAHAVSRALGGRYGVAHGVGCGLALPSVMALNAELDSEPYARLARALGVAEASADDPTNADHAIARVEELRQHIGIPGQLDLQPTAGELEQLCEWVVANAGPNPRPTGEREARRLLSALL